MSKDVIVAPSLLGADFGRLEAEIKSVESAGADWLHVDVMDGHFVPPITFSTNMVEVCKRSSSLPVDAHLMVREPEKLVPSFLDAEADVITIHLEATAHTHRLLQFIRDGGKKAGLALNPGTPASAVWPVLELCDLVLVMTVNPGWGGQSFLDSCLSKVQELADQVSKSSLNTLIEVDGGVTAETGARCRDAGANVLVAGSYVFGSSDTRMAIRSLRS